MMSQTVTHISHNHISQKDVKGSKIIILYYMSMIYDIYAL